MRRVFRGSNWHRFDNGTAADQPQNVYNYPTVDPDTDPATYPATSSMDQGGVPGSDETYDGHTRTVTYDASWRTLTDTSATGLETSYNYYPSSDILESSINPRGLETTTAYDSQWRPTGLLRVSVTPDVR